MDDLSENRASAQILLSSTATSDAYAQSLEMMCGNEAKKDWHDSESNATNLDVCSQIGSK